VAKCNLGVVKIKTMQAAVFSIQLTSAAGRLVSDTASMLVSVTHCAINYVLPFASFRAVLPDPSPPLMVSTYPFPLYFYAV